VVVHEKGRRDHVRMVASKHTHGIGGSPETEGVTAPIHRSRPSS
jgi:hypothetical protein